ncbi:phosphate regulon sensor histidine kinase PhoR [Pasteurellaceae bacterium TAE3-ERU1]|nr:phosphate regulon sensor histidine kinase PhoR [Pasteurellaceae bacterium TAE3-ERU1]
MIVNWSLELLISALLAVMFSLFAGHFWAWFTFFLVLALLFHHYNENKLLNWLHNNEHHPHHQIGIWDTLSQTIAYQKRHTRKERFKTLRVLSRLNKQIQFLPDAVLICQRDGTILWCNIAAQELFGFYWHKKVVKNIFNVIFYPEFKVYADNNESNAPLILMPNETQYIEISKGEYDEQLTMYIARDITQVIKLLHSRQTFLSNFNHELRTPLTVLQGYLELLHDDSIAGQARSHSLEVMQQQVARMESLLKQLTLLVKIETSAGGKMQSAVNVGEIINQAQHEAELLANGKVEIQREVDDSLLIRGNNVEITSLITNLIINAVKHAHAERLRIVWQHREAGGYFAVQDDGVGIAARHLPRLTERFYRVDDGRSEGGSGLGLAIVKHALIHLNSQLHIDSEVGKGSTFSFVIPPEHLLDAPHFNKN